MHKHLMNQWLDNLDSLIASYSAMARLGDALLEQTHRNRNDALHLYLQLSKRQLNDFLTWFSPVPVNRSRQSDLKSTGVALTIGLGPDSLAALRQALARKGQRLIIVELVKDGFPAREGPADLRLQCDIRNYKACQGLLRRIETEIGPVELIIKDPQASLASQSATTDAVLDNELDGIYNLTRHVLPSMMQRGHGDIILLTPAQADDPQTLTQLASVTGFIRTLGKELQPYGISVNCISLAQLHDSDYTHQPEETPEAPSVDLQTCQAVP